MRIPRITANYIKLQQITVNYSKLQQFAVICPNLARPERTKSRTRGPRARSRRACEKFARPARSRRAEVQGIIGSVAKWFFGRSLATGFLTRLRRLLCSAAERWPVQPTSTPAPSPPPAPCNLLRGAWGRQAAVSWGRALVASLVPSLISRLLDPGLVPGLVPSAIASLAPLRHASNLCGPFLCHRADSCVLGPP